MSIIQRRKSRRWRETFVVYACVSPISARPFVYTLDVWPSLSCRAALERRFRAEQAFLIYSVPFLVEIPTHSTLLVPSFPSREFFFQNPSFRCRFEREKFHRVIFKFLPLPLARTCLEVLFINSYKWSILLLLIYIHIRRNIFYCLYKLHRV